MKVLFIGALFLFLYLQPTKLHMKTLFFPIFLLLSTLLYTQEKYSPVAANNRFAINFYQQLVNENPKQNLCFSPISLSESMAMTYHGAKEKTQEEIQKVMGFQKNSSDVNKGFLKLNSRLKAYTKNIEFVKVNSLWAQKDYTFKKQYFDEVVNSYVANFSNVDFKKKKNRKKTIEKINQWANKNTQGKISAFINPDALSKNTRLILANAIYFNAQWQISFDKEKNRTEDFYTLEQTQRVEYMRNKSGFNYYYDDLIDVLELPYQGKQQSMFILLPKQRDGIRKLEKTFDMFYLNNILADKRPESVIVTLPKFSISSDYELSKTFKNLGMVHPFDDDADFSGMTGKQNLFIDKIFHKCTLEVSEKGTEASAASAVVMSRKNGHRDVAFMADHPFMYIIRDNNTGTILFMGHVLSIEK